MIKSKRRYHIDNVFFHSPVKCGLFKLYQLCDVNCSSDFEVSTHMMACDIEITYIVSGEGIFGRNGTLYNVSEGMVFITTKKDSHYIHSTKSNPLHYMGVAFSCDETHPDYLKIEQVIKYFENLVNPVTNDIYNIFNSFVLMLNDFINNDSIMNLTVASYLSLIVSYSYRDFLEQTQKYYYHDIKKDQTNPLVYDIVNYIDTQIFKIKKLEDLTETFGYSYGYISKVFSKAMGISIQDYYTKRRFEQAIDMLKSDVTLSYISEKLGFANLQCFCKAFKKHCHLSPGEYRKFLSSNCNIK